MPQTKNLSEKRRRFERLASRLARIGPILQGTITERTITRPAPDDSEQPRTYGPYYQWTWKKRGKTVTVNLSPSQAKTYQKAIDNHRAMEEIIGELRSLSIQMLEMSTQGVKKRKRLK
jgi:hypothetical protein